MKYFLLSIYITYLETNDVFEFRQIFPAKTEQEAIELGLRNFSKVMSEYFYDEELKTNVGEDLILSSKLTFGIKQTSIERETNVEIFRNRRGNIFMREEIDPDEVEIIEYADDFYNILKARIKRFPEVEEYRPKKVIQIPLVQYELTEELKKTAEKESTVKRFLKYDETKREPPFYYHILRKIKDNPYQFSTYGVAKSLKEEGYFPKMRTDSLRRRITELRLERKGLVEKKYIKVGRKVYQKLRITKKGERYYELLW